MAGYDIKLTVVESSGIISKSPPIQQYVTRKNETAIVGEKIELFCIYSGKYVISISTLTIKIIFKFVLCCLKKIQSSTSNELVY